MFPSATTVLVTSSVSADIDHDINGRRRISRSRPRSGGGGKGRRGRGGWLDGEMPLPRCPNAASAPSWAPPVFPTPAAAGLAEVAARTVRSRRGGRPSTRSRCRGRRSRSTWATVCGRSRPDEASTWEGERRGRGTTVRKDKPIFLADRLLKKGGCGEIGGDQDGFDGRAGRGAAPSDCFLGLGSLEISLPPPIPWALRPPGPPPPWLPSKVSRSALFPRRSGNRPQKVAGAEQTTGGHGPPTRSTVAPL